MMPVTKEEALKNALASSSMEGFRVSPDIVRNCRRLFDGEVDVDTMIKELIAQENRGIAMPKFTIVGGVNGVGKSSLSGVLKNCLNDIGVVVDPDKLIAQHGGDEYVGGKAAITRLQDCLSQRIDFTEESTLSGYFSRRMALMARDAGYMVRLYYVGLDTAEESIRRIANRVARGGHNISKQDVHRRFAKRFQDLAKLLPLCDEVTFYDNDNGFRVVAIYRNGELLLDTDTPPAWLLDLRQEIAI